MDKDFYLSCTAAVVCSYARQFGCPQCPYYKDKRICTNQEAVETARMIWAGVSFPVCQDIYGDMMLKGKMNRRQDGEKEFVIAESAFKEIFKKQGLEV